MAILPSLGHGGRGCASREHGSVHGEQLLDAWLLEELASQLQSLDHPVRCTSSA